MKERTVRNGGVIVKYSVPIIDSKESAVSWIENILLPSQIVVEDYFIENSERYDDGGFELQRKTIEDVKATLIKYQDIDNLDISCNVLFNKSECTILIVISRGEIILLYQENSNIDIEQFEKNLNLI